MVSRDLILEKLSSVVDPELGLNIVDMGLIYDIIIHEKKKTKKKGSSQNQRVDIKMTFTTPACPLMGMILDQVKTKLEELPDLDVGISVVFDPPWTPERMSQRAKIQTGMV